MGAGRALLGLLAAVSLVRVVDIFLLRLDEVLGEAVVSKLLGFALVAAYLGATGGSLGSIGFRRKSLGRAVLIGAVGTALLFAAGYGLQVAVFSVQGKAPALDVVAVSPLTGLEAGLAAGLWIAFGNVANSFMEEGLFRGVVLGRLRARMSFWSALLLQAALFAAWHLVWPLKAYLAGDVGAGAALGDAAATLVSTGTLGLVWGYMYLKTGSLWAGWTAHTVHNMAVDLLYIQAGGALVPATELTAFGAVFVPGMLALMLWTRFWAGRFRETDRFASLRRRFGIG